MAENVSTAVPKPGQFFGIDANRTLGQIVWVPCPLTGGLRKCKHVRNVNGSAITPGKALICTANGIDVTLSGAAAVIAGVADDQLPSSGVPDDNTFLMIVEGYATVTAGTGGLSLNGAIKPDASSNMVAAAVGTDHVNGVAAAAITATNSGYVMVKGT